jgi:hypothetical protein
MPVALVGIAYAGYGGYALWAGAAGWAAVSAGMMVAGGAATLVGNATGDKGLMETGMLVGTVGSLGYAATSASSSAAAAGEKSAADFAASGEPIKMGASSLPTDASLSKGLMNGSSSVSGMPAAGIQAGSNASVESLILKSQAAMEKTAMTNMMVQTGSGVLQGLATYQTGQENKKAMDEQLAEKRRLEERDYANRNNLTNLKVQTPTNLPNMQKVAQQRGLISAPSTLQVA